MNLRSTLKGRISIQQKKNQIPDTDIKLTESSTPKGGRATLCEKNRWAEGTASPGWILLNGLSHGNQLQAHVACRRVKPQLAIGANEFFLTFVTLHKAAADWADVYEVWSKQLRAVWALI